MQALQFLRTISLHFLCMSVSVQTAKFKSSFSFQDEMYCSVELLIQNPEPEIRLNETEKEKMKCKMCNLKPEYLR
jgi:hypothetical protein